MSGNQALTRKRLIALRIKMNELKTQYENLKKDENTLKNQDQDLGQKLKDFDQKLKDLYDDLRPKKHIKKRIKKQKKNLKESIEKQKEDLEKRMKTLRQSKLVLMKKMTDLRNHYQVFIAGFDFAKSQLLERLETFKFILSQPKFAKIFFDFYDPDQKKTSKQIVLMSIDFCAPLLNAMPTLAPCIMHAIHSTFRDGNVNNGILRKEVVPFRPPCGDTTIKSETIHCSGKCLTRKPHKPCYHHHEQEETRYIRYLLEHPEKVNAMIPLGIAMRNLSNGKSNVEFLREALLLFVKSFPLPRLCEVMLTQRVKTDVLSHQGHPITNHADVLQSVINTMWLGGHPLIILFLNMDTTGRLAKTSDFYWVKGKLRLKTQKATKKTTKTTEPTQEGIKESQPTQEALKEDTQEAHKEDAQEAHKEDAQEALKEDTQEAHKEDTQEAHKEDTQVDDLATAHFMSKMSKSRRIAVREATKEETQDAPKEATQDAPKEETQEAPKEETQEALKEETQEETLDVDDLVEFMIEMIMKFDNIYVRSDFVKNNRKGFPKFHYVYMSFAEMIVNLLFAKPMVSWYARFKGQLSNFSKSCVRSHVSPLQHMQFNGPFFLRRRDGVMYTYGTSGPSVLDLGTLRPCGTFDEVVNDPEGDFYGQPRYNPHDSSFERMF